MSTLIAAGLLALALFHTYLMICMGMGTFDWLLHRRGRYVAHIIQHAIHYIIFINSHIHAAEGFKINNYETNYVLFLIFVLRDFIFRFFESVF
jgi:hypothetical protein